MSEELVIRFFSALEAGDIDTLREIYAPDAVIWHNDDLIEQPVDENLRVLRALHRVVSGLRYDITRRVAAPDGVLQQHAARSRLARSSCATTRSSAVAATRRSRSAIRQRTRKSRRCAKRLRRFAIIVWSIARSTRRSSRARCARAQCSMHGSRESSMVRAIRRPAPAVR